MLLTDAVLQEVDHIASATRRFDRSVSGISDEVIDPFLSAWDWSSTININHHSWVGGLHILCSDRTFCT